jgi:hypothetical protein
MLGHDAMHAHANVRIPSRSFVRSELNGVEYLFAFWNGAREDGFPGCVEDGDGHRDERAKFREAGSDVVELHEVNKNQKKMFDQERRTS